MNRHALVLAAAFLMIGTALAACSKQQSESETVNAPAETPSANESAANASGTTTYYGSPDEQANN